MSLRDQLVAKGLVSDKRKRDVERQLKQERKNNQGNKRKLREEQAEARARAEAEEAARRDAAARARAEASAAREAHEHVHRVRQIITSRRIGGRGPTRFFYRVGDTRQIGRLSLPDALVRDLRTGKVAVAGFFDEAGRPVAHLVPRVTAEKLAEVAPEALWHWSRDGGALDDPSQGPLRVTWEPSLRARRVTEVTR